MHPASNLHLAPGSSSRAGPNIRHSSFELRISSPPQEGIIARKITLRAVTQSAVGSRPLGRRETGDRRQETGDRSQDDNVAPHFNPHFLSPASCPPEALLFATKRTFHKKKEGGQFQHLAPLVLLAPFDGRGNGQMRNPFLRPARALRPGVRSSPSGAVRNGQFPSPPANLTQPAPRSLAARRAGCGGWNADSDCAVRGAAPPPGGPRGTY
jgi:hypothetical protein